MSQTLAHDLLLKREFARLVTGESFIVGMTARQLAKFFHSRQELLAFGLKTELLKDSVDESGWKLFLTVNALELRKICVEHDDCLVDESLGIACQYRSMRAYLDKAQAEKLARFMEALEEERQALATKFGQIRGE